MLKLIFLPILFFFIILITLFFMTGQVLVRWWRNMTMTPEQRRQAEEEYFRRTSQRGYQPEPEDNADRFSGDYFSRDTEFEAQQRRQAENARQQQRRSTRVDGGVTIIDGRDQRGQRKIIPDTDGEYVSFEEEH